MRLRQIVIDYLSYVQDVVGSGNTLRIKVPKQGDQRKNLSKYLIEQNLVPVRIEEKSISLEDAFVSITQDNIDVFTVMGGKK